MSSKTKAKPKQPAKTRKTAPPEKAKSVKTAAKSETKIEKILNLLKKEGGASIKMLSDATDWQKHTVRSTLSRVITRKMGLKLEFTKDDRGIRHYKIISRS